MKKPMMNGMKKTARLTRRFFSVRFIVQLSGRDAETVALRCGVL